MEMQGIFVENYNVMHETIDQFQSESPLGNDCKHGNKEAFAKLQSKLNRLRFLNLLA